MNPRYIVIIVDHDFSETAFDDLVLDIDMINNAIFIAKNKNKNKIREIGNKTKKE